MWRLISRVWQRFYGFTHAVNQSYTISTLSYAPVLLSKNLARILKQLIINFTMSLDWDRPNTHAPKPIFGILTDAAFVQLRVVLLSVYVRTPAERRLVSWTASVMARASPRFWLRPSARIPVHHFTGPRAKYISAWSAGRAAARWILHSLDFPSSSLRVLHK